MTRTEAVEWQERLFPRRRKRILNDDGTPTNQEEDLPVTLCEICLSLKASCNGAADPWDDEFLRDTMGMLKARAETWAQHGKHRDVMDAAVLQMVCEAARIASAELLERAAAGKKILYAIPKAEADEVIDKLRKCDGTQYDCIVLGSDECRKLLEVLK